MKQLVGHPGVDGGAEGGGKVAVWGSALAVVLITAIAVIPRKEHLVTGTKMLPEKSSPNGSKPSSGGYNAYNRFLVATRIWDFVRMGASRRRKRDRS